MLITNIRYMLDKDQKEAMEYLQHFARRKEKATVVVGFLAGFILVIVVVTFCIYLVDKSN